MVKYIESNRLGDYWISSSDDKRFDRYITVEQNVATLLVGEFAGSPMATKPERLSYD